MKTIPINIEIDITGKAPTCMELNKLIALMARNTQVDGVSYQITGARAICKHDNIDYKEDQAIDDAPGYYSWSCSDCDHEGADLLEDKLKRS